MSSKMDTRTAEQKHLKKSAVLNNLKSLMVQNESGLQIGTAPLCLTPEILLILNHGFESSGYPINSSTNSSVHEQLNYIHTIVNSVKCLRLSHGSGSTIQAPVNLSHFTHLTSLDVKRIPPHWIQGLTKLKNKLVTIRMSRSINDLQDLLRRSTDSGACHIAWSALRKLYLSNNFLRELDDSLELIPLLEILDLSHNYLRTTSTSLQYLSELICVNLAYNSLESVPQFSQSATKSLRTLVLRGNHLDSLNGVEELLNLEVLDVSSNILCSHDCLTTLKNLTALYQLYLDDNPLTNNAQHRVRTAAALYPKVVHQLKLDGRSFNETEVRYANVLRSSVRQTPEGSSCDRMPKTEQATTSEGKGQRRVKSTVVSSFADIPQPLDDDYVTVLNDSVDSSNPVTFETPTDPCNKSVSLTKARIELLRQEFGDSWLQSVDGEFQSSMSTGHYTAQVEQPGLLSDNSDYLESAAAMSEQSHDVPDSSHTSPLEIVSVDVHAPQNSPSDDENDGNDDTKYGNGTVEVSSLEEVNTYNHADSNDSDIDSSEFDPFIVKFEGEDSEEFIITITQTRIVEKNLEGSVTEILDLNALASAEIIHQAHQVIVHLRLDYFRKDRRQRRYVMEDQCHADRLIEILQPTLSDRLKNGHVADTMECLKCGKKFESIKHRKRERLILSNICPHCNSDMVIEHTTASESVNSTPYGSAQSSPDQSFKDGSFKSPILSSTPAKGHARKPSQDSITSSIDGASFHTANNSAEDRSRQRSDTESTLQGSQPGISTDDSSINDHISEDEFMPVNSQSVTPDDTLSYISYASDGGSSVANEDDVTDNLYRDPLTGLRFDFSDLSYIDHRLKLYMSMNHYDGDEQTKCVLRAKCVQYLRSGEFSLLLVVTDMFIYLLKVTAEYHKKYDNLSSALDLVDKQPIWAVIYIDIGLYHQTIRLEFEKVGYCLLVRDENLGRNLQVVLSDLMSSATFKEESRLQSISKMTIEYLTQIEHCLREHQPEQGEEFEFSLVHYMLAFLKTAQQSNIDTVTGCDPISLVMDNEHIYVLQENFHVPISRESCDGNRKKHKESYFKFQSVIPINEIAHMKVRKQSCEVDIEGFEEQTLEFLKSFIMTSFSAVNHFVTAIQEPWRKLYGVELAVDFAS